MAVGRPGLAASPGADIDDLLLALVSLAGVVHQPPKRLGLVSQQVDGVKKLRDRLVVVLPLTADREAIPGIATDEYELARSDVIEFGH